jgi:hypothetical protein
VNWRLANKADPQALALADRHYSRRPRCVGSKQIGTPARQLVLVSLAGDALWETRWPRADKVWHRWPGAWINGYFRNESPARASELIREAVACTRWYFGDPPPLGMVSWIDPRRVRPTMVRGLRTWGWTYLRAGFEPDGELTDGKLTFVMRPAVMPEALPPVGADLRLDLATVEADP